MNGPYFRIIDEMKASLVYSDAKKEEANILF